nr:hypothetical protein CFP56_16244 [Quercus suber]
MASDMLNFESSNIRRDNSVNWEALPRILFSLRVIAQNVGCKSDPASRQDDTCHVSTIFNRDGLLVIPTLGFMSSITKLWSVCGLDSAAASVSGVALVYVRRTMPSHEDKERCGLSELANGSFRCDVGLLSSLEGLRKGRIGG